MRRHVPHHRTLDRADVGDNSAGLEVGRDLLRHRAARADGDAEDDEVGIRNRFGIGLDHAVDNAQLGDPRAGFLRSRGGDDFACESLRPRRARDRTADQAEADQGDAGEERGVAHFAARKSRKASTTRRLASSVPMVIRSACGRP